MLKIIEKKRAKGPLDYKVKSLAYQLVRLWGDKEEFKRAFTHQLAWMKQMNHIHPQFAYKLIEKENAIELWHVKPSDLSTDRLLLEIEYTDDNL
jgi:hypothetical protein